MATDLKLGIELEYEFPPQDRYRDWSRPPAISWGRLPDNDDEDDDNDNVNDDDDDGDDEYHLDKPGRSRYNSGEYASAPGVVAPVPADWAIKGDGSLNSGWEIVSPPLTWDTTDWHRLFARMMPNLQRAGAVAESSCGAHIHVSPRNRYDIWGNTIVFKREELYTLCRSVLANEPHLYRLAVGDSRALRGTRYCTPVSSSMARAVLRERRAWTPIDRYCGLNLRAIQSHGSIEFRFFNSTTDPMVAASWVEIVRCLISHVLEKGTAVRPHKHTASFLESIGADARWFTYFDFAQSKAKSDTEPWEEGVYRIEGRRLIKKPLDKLYAKKSALDSTPLEDTALSRATQELEEAREEYQERMLAGATPQESRRQVGDQGRYQDVLQDILSSLRRTLEASGTEDPRVVNAVLRRDPPIGPLQEFVECGPDCSECARIREDRARYERVMYLRQQHNIENIYQYYDQRTGMRVVRAEDNRRDCPQTESTADDPNDYMFPLISVGTADDPGTRTTAGSTAEVGRWEFGPITHISISDLQREITDDPEPGVAVEQRPRFFTRQSLAECLTSMRWAMSELGYSEQEIADATARIAPIHPRDRLDYPTDDTMRHFRNVMNLRLRYGVDAMYREYRDEEGSAPSV